MILIEKHRHYRIFESDDGYIVQNCSMDNFAHTHIRNLKSARWICELSIRQKAPHNLPVYFIESLIRVNDDKNYLCKLKDLLSAKKKKKDRYFNSNKGVRKK